ncbi:flavin reductase family protein [Streptomyces sp. NPDC002896]|uniref:flavin reductase family protein n=1 Tax=Streptomyces sp. NPDC002896 TaxID=3154438 RepID=UPI00331FFE94
MSGIASMTRSVRRPGTTATEYPVVDGAALRHAAGAFATGVCVVTTEDPVTTAPHGMTVNAFTSLTLDPPTVLVCLNRGSTTHGLVTRAGRFALNVLQAEQEALAQRFASRDTDKFTGVDWHSGALGVPLLDGTLAALECEVETTYEVHTHTVVIASVHSAMVAEGAPLLFHRGRLGTPR